MHTTSDLFVDGNIGIGTTNPLYTLHIHGHSYIRDNLTIGNVTYTSYSEYNTSNTVNNIIKPPSSNGLLNGVSITALNRRTRASYATTDRVISNWDARSAAQANTWYGLCWAAELGLFCATSSSGTSRVMTSPDGINWTNRTAAAAV